MAPDIPTVASRIGYAMSQAAAAWLADLDDEQRTLAWWGAPGGEHEVERRRWYYAPTDHGGLAFNRQFDWQQRQAMQLVVTGLSPEGYALVSTIMGNENILDRVEHFRSSFDTRRGRDPSRYYLRVFGDPLGQAPWGWRFGGHHVSLNFLVAEGEVRSTTPRFFGLDPAVSTLPGGRTLDPLGAFQQGGRKLVASLSLDARDAAIILDRAPADIVLGNRSAFRDGAVMLELPDIFRRSDGDEALIERLRRGGAARDAVTGYGSSDHETLSVTTSPKGVSGAELGADSRHLLERLVRTYHDGLPVGLAPTWNVDDLFFAWAGPIESGAPNYYRIQGEDVLIEWDNTARNANHAHSVVRRLTNDFGADVLGTPSGRST